MAAIIKNILVPTDFSDSSEHALHYAASLGERFAANAPTHENATSMTRKESSLFVARATGEWCDVYACLQLCPCSVGWWRAGQMIPGAEVF